MMEPGCTFSPSDKELTDVFLRREIAGKPLHSPLIHRVDIYSAKPEELVAGLEHARDRENEHVWYFYTPGAGKKRRRSRIVAGDSKQCWHSEKSRPVEGSAVCGYSHMFSYKIDKERAGWIMYEYGIAAEHGGGDLVLCKVYRSKRTPTLPTTPASSRAARSYESESEPCFKKRKVSSAFAGDDHPERAPPLDATAPPVDEDLNWFEADSGVRQCGQAAEPEAHNTAGLVVAATPGPEAPPCSNLWREMEHEFETLYHGDPEVDNMGLQPVHGDVGAPCPSAAQPEEGGVAAADEGEAEPDFIYGLPCPPFSPAGIEELLRGSGDVLRVATNTSQQSCLDSLAGPLCVGWFS